MYNSSRPKVRKLQKLHKLSTPKCVIWVYTCAAGTSDSSQIALLLFSPRKSEETPWFGESSLCRTHQTLVLFFVFCATTSLFPFLLLSIPCCWPVLLLFCHVICDPSSAKPCKFSIRDWDINKVFRFQFCCFLKAPQCQTDHVFENSY